VRGEQKKQGPAPRHSLTEIPQGGSLGMTRKKREGPKLDPRFGVSKLLISRVGIFPFQMNGRGTEERDSQEEGVQPAGGRVEVIFQNKVVN